MRRVRYPVRNRLLSALTADDAQLLAEGLEPVAIDKGEVLFEPGQDVEFVYFPGPGMIASFLMTLEEGVTTEAAIIGQEGALGGIVSHGRKPAYARAVVQIAGDALRLPVVTLDNAKQRSPGLREHFARYADCLLAQLLQSVACNAVHDYESRLARWLLTLHDRVGGSRLPVTHQFASEMLGVQRSYTGRIMRGLARSGAIRTGRGQIMIADREQLERRSCECYANLRNHYERILPGVYPSGKD